MDASNQNRLTPEAAKEFGDAIDKAIEAAIKGMIGGKSTIEYVTPFEACVIGLVIGFVAGMAALCLFLIHLEIL